MKKFIAPFIIVSSLLALTACTPSETNGQSSTLNDQAITILPQWDLDKAKGTFGKATKVDTSPLGEGAGEVIPTKEAPTLGSEQQVLFTDKANGCTIEGTIFYTDSYKENRGDTFNSKEYLYSLVVPSEKALQKEATTTINGTDYVSGQYTTPAEWGDNRYHKTAVRVFSTPISIANYIEQEGRPDSYKSDPSKGLPVVKIDYACANKKDLTNKKWDQGISFFHLLFEAPKAPEVDKSEVIESDPENLNGKGEDPTDKPNEELTPADPNEAPVPVAPEDAVEEPLEGVEGK